MTLEPDVARLHVVLVDLLSAGRLLLGAAACSVAVISDSRRDLVYIAADGEGAALVTGMTIPVTDGIAGFVAGSGQSLTINDVRSDRRFSQETAERTGYVPTALTAVPLQVGGETIGVLSVLDPLATAPSGALNALASAVAGIVDLRTAAHGSDAGAAGLARAGRDLASRVAADTELGRGERVLAERMLLVLADHLENG